MIQIKKFSQTKKTTITIPLEVYTRIKQIEDLEKSTYVSVISHLLELGYRKYLKNSTTESSSKGIEIEILKRDIQQTQSLILKAISVISEDKNIEHVCDRCGKETSVLNKRRKMEEVVFCQGCGKRVENSTPIRFGEEVYQFCTPCIETKNYEKRLQAMSAAMKIEYGTF